MPRPFRFGIINEQMPTRREEWLERARRAEATGYATFLLRDHFVPDFFGDQFAPLPALAVAATVTSTLHVGTLVLANDFRHPVALAKEAATLDLLTDGRFELGIGAGWLRKEYDQAGIPFASPGTRIERLGEAIQILKGLWRDGPFTFTGTHYQVSNLDGFPKPLQRPQPPILIGGGGPRVLALAGREADTVGILTTSITTGSLVVDPLERSTAAVAAKVERVRQAAGDRFPAIELNMVPDIVVTDTRRAATEAYLGAQGWSGISVEQVWDMPAVFIGSIDHIVTEMERRRAELGFSYFVVSDAEIDGIAPIVARLAGT